MKTTLVIPTYQEAANISRLISQIEAEKIKLGEQLNILVVDDSSPDGTGEIVKELQKKFTNLYLLKGKKRGLGNAYQRGFKYAIEKLKAEIVIQMDADFSHHPADIKRLLKEINNGFDVTIGSRYIKGGKVQNWSLFRQWLSKIGNLVCRKVLGLEEIADCTAGFRAIRVSNLKKVNFQNFQTNGYSFQVKLLYELVKSGSRIKEVPVQFIDRQNGTTKLGIWDIMEGIRTLARLKFLN